MQLNTVASDAKATRRSNTSPLVCVCALCVVCEMGGGATEVLRKSNSASVPPDLRVACITEWYLLFVLHFHLS